IAGAAVVAFLARSFIPTPVAWDTRNRWSIASVVSSPWTWNALNAADIALMSISSPMIRVASSTWLLNFSRVGPVRPSRVLTSATTCPICSNSAGTFLPTVFADATRSSSALPVAPVPTRIVSDTSSNVSPIPYSALPARTAPPATAATPASIALPNLPPTSLPDLSASFPASLARVEPKFRIDGRTSIHTASRAAKSTTGVLLPCLAGLRPPFLCLLNLGDQRVDALRPLRLPQPVYGSDRARQRSRLRGLARRELDDVGV